MKSFRTYYIHQDFEVFSVSADHWKKGLHRHYFFELLFIQEGQGIHILNENELNYKKNDIYLLTPQDHHSFCTQSFTTFHCIRFSADFLSGSELYNKGWLLRLQNKMKNHNKMFGDSFNNKEDKALVILMIEQILLENNGRNIENELMIKCCLMVILQAAFRNVHPQFDTPLKAPSYSLDIDRMIMYIQDHIIERDKITRKEIAKNFNISEKYIGEYFKKGTGSSIRSFIDRCKLKVIERRIIQSNMTFRQISQELGFNDQSHFNKFIKNKIGLSPKKFKERLTVVKRSNS